MASSVKATPTLPAKLSPTLKETFMRITIRTSDGLRPGAEPPGGSNDELTLVRSLLVTLAAEHLSGRGSVNLVIDFREADPGRLVAIAKALTAMGAGKAKRVAGEVPPSAIVLPMPVARTAGSEERETGPGG
jgi:hypothetical protein